MSVKYSNQEMNRLFNYEKGRSFLMTNKLYLGMDLLLEIKD